MILTDEGKERTPNTIKRIEVRSRHNLRAEVKPPINMVRDANREVGYSTNPHTRDLSAKPSAKKLVDYRIDLLKIAKYMKEFAKHPNMER